MSNLDQILSPIAGSNPSGEDLEYDSRFQELKSSIEVSDGNNPINWKTVKKQSLELLNDGRHIEFLVLLAVSLVDTEGYQGLRDGLHVFTKSIEGFWDTIYPELDMEELEPERHEMRLNLIAQLGEKPGKLGDKLSFVERILKAPLSINNPRLAITYWPIWESDKMDLGDSSDAEAAKTHIGQMPFEEKKLIFDLIEESIQCLKSLSDFLMKKTGSAYNGPFDECLLPTLKQIGKVFAVEGGGQPQIPAGDNADIEGSSTMHPSEVPVQAPVGQTPVPLGSINSREDVKKALEKIIDYYNKNEPSSPIPFLAERTKKLVDANFMDVIKNISKESEQQFKKALNIT